MGARHRRLYLGQLTSETGENYFTTFVSGGPKNYAYKLDDGNTCCKVRNNKNNKITLNYRNSLQINLDTISRMVRGIGEEKITVNNPCKIVRDVKSKNIISRPESRDYRIFYTKRVKIGNFDTVPYGF